MLTISVRRLTKVYATSAAGARDVSLDVAGGEHIGIVGPSGPARR